MTRLDRMQSTPPGAGPTKLLLASHEVWREARRTSAKVVRRAVECRRRSTSERSPARRGVDPSRDDDTAFPSPERACDVNRKARQTPAVKRGHSPPPGSAEEGDCPRRIQSIRLSRGSLESRRVPASRPDCPTPSATPPNAPDRFIARTPSIDTGRWRPGAVSPPLPRRSTGPRKQVR